jgi:probable F420-dependent oxidoreductase
VSRPVRFIASFHAVPTFAEWKAMALDAERLGFYGVNRDDHFWPPVLAQPDETWPECFTLLSALAAITTKLHITQTVVCNAYRHPGLVAKMIATMDWISGGRMELGIGAGWYKPEFDAYGYDYPKASVRIAQLQEAVKVIKSLWTDSRTTFEGKYYRLKDAYCYPKPIQQPRPPIIIGGGGEKLLRVSAEEADIANISMIFSAGIITSAGLREHTEESFLRKRDTLRRHCDAIGRDWKELKIASQLFALCSRDEDFVKAMSEMSAAQVGVDPETARTFPNVAVGTPSEMIDMLSKRIDKLGIDVYVCNFLNPDVMETFATEVMPHLHPVKP